MLLGTFTRDDTGVDIRAGDTNDILINAANHTGLMFDMVCVTSARAGVRVTTPDHFPLVGRVDTGSDLSAYVSLAHGSHGLLSTHSAALMIARAISGTPSVIPDDLADLVSFARYINP